MLENVQKKVLKIVDRGLCLCHSGFTHGKHKLQKNENKSTT
jgi:hypothetical protein